MREFPAKSRDFYEIPLNRATLPRGYDCQRPPFPSCQKGVHKNNGDVANVHFHRALEWTGNVVGKSCEIQPCSRNIRRKYPRRGFPEVGFDYRGIITLIYRPLPWKVELRSALFNVITARDSTSFLETKSVKLANVFRVAPSICLYT